MRFGKSGKQFAALALRQRRGGDKKFGLYPPAFLILLLTKLRKTNKKTAAQNFPYPPHKTEKNKQKTAAQNITKRYG